MTSSVPPDTGAFVTSTSEPPSRRTRAVRAYDTAGSIQWNAVAEKTTS